MLVENAGYVSSSLEGSTRISLCYLEFLMKICFNTGCEGKYMCIYCLVQSHAASKEVSIDHSSSGFQVQVPHCHNSLNI